MSYDADAFARDLDLAINHVVEIFNEWLARSTPVNPQLRPGMQANDAIAETCFALAIRKLSERQIREWFSQVLDETRAMLITKNQAYGDSALSPLRIFATSSPKEQLLVRIDDKISRMNRGSSAGEDPAKDALGYFLLVTIAEMRERQQ